MGCLSSFIQEKEIYCSSCFNLVILTRADGGANFSRNQFRTNEDFLNYFEGKFSFICGRCQKKCAHFNPDCQACKDYKNQPIVEGAINVVKGGGYISDTNFWRLIKREKPTSNSFLPCEQHLDFYIKNK